MYEEKLWATLSCCACNISKISNSSKQSSQTYCVQLIISFSDLKFATSPVIWNIWMDSTTVPTVLDYLLDLP